MDHRHAIAVVTFAMALLLTAGGLALLSVIWWPQRDRRLALLLTASLLLGAARLALAQPVFTERSVWHYIDQQVAITGVIAQQPDRRDDRQTVVLEVESIDPGNGPQPAEGRVLLRLPPLPELRYGQRLTAEGRLEQPRSRGSFDYRAYLARKGIHVLMTQPRMTLAPESGGAAWQATLLRLNDQARRTSLHLISEPHASLLVGILLGVQSTLPDEVREAFSITGLTHILVISGWNITIIVVGISGALAACGVGRKRAVGCSLPVIALYVCFVGVSPSVVRAAIMGSLAVLAVLVDRESDAWTSLLVACVVMAIADPNVLWDIGFQLSALATAGLFAFGRLIEQRLTAWRPLQWNGSRWMIEPLTATLAASALTLPIIVYHFGRLSIIAPLANVVILPVVPYAMLFGALATAAGMVWMPAGELLALLAWPFLEWMLLASRWLARVPGASATLPPFGAWWVWGYYAIIAAMWGWRRRESCRASPQLQGESA